MVVEKPSEELIEAFITQHADSGADDMLVYIAQQLMYAENISVPIRGLGDDVDAVVSYVRSEVDKVLDELCIRVRRDQELIETLKKSEKTQVFVIIADIVKNVISEASFANMDFIDGNIVMAVTFVINKISSSLEKFCNDR